MCTAPPVKRAFFPLDEELGLLPRQRLSPLLHESVVRLGSRLTFREAADELSYFRRTRLSSSTVRRLTQDAGASQVAVQTHALAADEPSRVSGSRLQLLTLDGAFVPVVGGEWKEVKTLTVGEVGEAVLERDAWVVHSTNLSYFSRLADVDSFMEAAALETRRRGTATALTVCAVTDGALWIQRAVDALCPTALRILDFMHAIEYVSQAGQAVYGADTVAFHAWFDQQRTQLLEGRPQRVIDALQHLSVEVEPHASEALHKVIDESWSYLRQRLPMMQYPAFQALGYPIGSGAGESANKVVVERRLKGAGMRWREANVNPMLALTNVLANGRWAEAWPHILDHRNQQAWQRRLQRHQAAPHPLSTLLEPPPQTPDAPPPAKPPYRPPADHPWRGMSIGRTSRTAVA